MSRAVRQEEGKTLRDHPSILSSYDSRAGLWPRVDTAAPLLWLSDRFGLFRTPSAAPSASILCTPGPPTIGSGCRPENAESVYWVLQAGLRRADRVVRIGKVMLAPSTAPRSRTGSPTVDTFLGRESRE